MKWKIYSKDFVMYLDPEENSMILYGCKLINKENISKRIYNGENKIVCAWIECQHFVVYNYKFVPNFEKISFNPRIYPHWMYNREIVDDRFFEILTTSGRNIYNG